MRKVRVVVEEGGVWEMMVEQEREQVVEEARRRRDYDVVKYLGGLMDGGSGSSREDL